MRSSFGARVRRTRRCRAQERAGINNAAPDESKTFTVAKVGWAVACTVAAAITGFVRFFDLPLDARVTLTYAEVVVLFVSFLYWLDCFRPEPVTRQRLRISIAVGIVTAVGTAALLAFLTLYHTVRIQKTVTGNEVTFEFDSPRFPVTLWFDVFSPGQTLKIEERQPSTSSDARLEDMGGSDVDKTIRLVDFKHPQKVTVKFGVTGDPNQLQVGVAKIEPNTTSVLYPPDFKFWLILSCGLGLGVLVGNVAAIAWRYRLRRRLEW